MSMNTINHIHIENNNDKRFDFEQTITVANLKKTVKFSTFRCK